MKRKFWTELEIMPYFERNGTVLLKMSRFGAVLEAGGYGLF
jgi:hypothetical protein